MKIDQELLTACFINHWSVTPRMMLIDSMIENGWEEFKALEAFEPPSLSRCLPLTYCLNGFGGGIGIGYGNGYGSGYGGGFGYGNCSDGNGSGRGCFYGISQNINQNRGHV